MKKIITLGFVALVSVIALVGCDKSSTTTTTPSDTNTVSTNAPAK